ESAAGTEDCAHAALRRRPAGEDRRLVDRALEGIEVLTEPTDERWPATAAEWSRGRARRREHTVHVETQDAAIKRPDEVRPRVERECRTIDRQQCAACGAHAELRDARLEEEHVLAVDPAVHGLLEDRAVLPRRRRTDPGLDGYGIRKIEHHARCDGDRRTGAREGCGGIAGNCAGLTA